MDDDDDARDNGFPERFSTPSSKEWMRRLSPRTLARTKAMTAMRMTKMALSSAC